MSRIPSVVFLVGLAVFAFGSACSVLSLLNQTPANGNCPAKRGDSLALLVLGASSIFPSGLILSSDSNSGLRSYFSRFRYVAFVFLWLKAKGPSWVLFGFIGTSAAAEILHSATPLSRIIPKSRPFYLIATTAFSLLCLSAAFSQQSVIFLASWFVLCIIELIAPGGNNESGHFWLQIFAPLLCGTIVFYSSTPMVALLMLIVHEISSLILLNTTLEENLDELFKERRASLLSMPLHRAAVVVGSLALSSTTSLALSPVIIADYITTQEVLNTGHVWVVFSVVTIAEKLGPVVGDYIHKQTSSLLKTGLVLFWSCVLATLPAITAYSLRGFRHGNPTTLWGSLVAEEIALIFACAMWHCCNSGLINVEHKIVSEWSSGIDPEAEQKALSSMAIAVAAAANIVIASALPDAIAVSVCTLFALLCSLVASMSYTLWFVQNDRGAWRLVDGEGRELLRVTG